MALKLAAYLLLTKIQKSISLLTLKLICVYSRKFIRGERYKSDYEFSAANGEVMKTYGTELLTLNFG